MWWIHPILGINFPIRFSICFSPIIWIWTFCTAFSSPPPPPHIYLSPLTINLTADSGFLVGGGADPLGGCQHTILSNFPKNCMKLRKFWAPKSAKSATAYWRHFALDIRCPALKHWSITSLSSVPSTFYDWPHVFNRGSNKVHNSHSFVSSHVCIGLLP